MWTKSIFVVQGAGNAVKRATDALVNAALEAKRRASPEEEVVEPMQRTDISKFDAMRVQLEAMAEIQRKEKVINQPTA